MKKIKTLTLSIISFILAIALCPTCIPKTAAHAAESELAKNIPMLAIIIDDFGGYDQSGVDTMLSVDAPLTCAIMPNLENTEDNTSRALASKKEVIVHMPMQAHVKIPDNWYGADYIGNYDTKEQVYSKLDSAFESVKGAKGFNIHIGSGVCQKPNVLSSIYDYATENNLPFVDSRTHLKTKGDQVAETKNVVYLGRDEFLEPEGDRSYDGVKYHLMTGAQLALDRGYAIVIGHVGSHGGEKTAKAIRDSVQAIRDMGVEIVPLSKLYENLNTAFVNSQNDKTDNDITKN